jgi:4-amino-4-deoxy-L-arabinose transferase-like glycosyltransferase
VGYTKINHFVSTRRTWLIITILTIALLTYSQLVAYFGNEPFHLLAAQLINSGETPYLDFFYQHPPFFAYLIAVWMRLFGENWRSAHILSALLTSGSILVVATYLSSRLRGSQQSTPISAVVALLLGLNFYVIAFGTVALPFGLCLFLTVVAFRLVVARHKRHSTLLLFIGGLAAGAAAASLLLTIPVVLVIVVWLARYQPQSNRKRACLYFLAGAAIPFLPLFVLALQAPREVLFDLVEYHLFYRAGSDGNMFRWNLREIRDWFGSIQGFVLIALGVIGSSPFIKKSEPQPQRSDEVYLCASISVALSLFLAIPRPTFSFYFVLITPFVSILAATGLSTIYRLSWFADRRTWLLTALLGLYVVGLTSETYKMRREIFHADHKAIEEIARIVNQVTPQDGWVLAFDQVYFATKRRPPPGLENGFNPFSRADEWLAANRFDTVCVMAKDPRVRSLDLFARYLENTTINTPDFAISLFWHRLNPPIEQQ